MTLCLNMIVKDEAHVIGRCLASVRPFIDTWAIVDTGSTDGTQQLVRDALRDLPGELIERPWVNFAHNRNEALALARGRADYILIIDADDTLECDTGFNLPPLINDSYNVEILYNGFSFQRKQIVRDALPWHYRGVLHEYLHCDAAASESVLEGLRMHQRHDGARARDPHTYLKDAMVLERALLDDPLNARYVFYLAQSYRDAGDLERAIEVYRRRAQMGGWHEEVWWSLYQIARLSERAELPWGEVLQRYLEAWQYGGDRAEPLYRIGMRYQAARQFAVSHLFFSRAMKVPYPAGSRLFVEKSVYDSLLPIEYAVAAYYAGDHAAAIDTNNALLAGGNLPEDLRELVIKNRRFSLDALSSPRR